MKPLNTARIVSACPTQEELVAFTQGLAPLAALQALGEHLSDCSACAGVLGSLPEMPDALLSSLRGLGDATVAPDPSSLQEEMSKIETAAADPSWAAMPLSQEEGVPAHLESLREYQLLDRLGQGGMGVVYRAMHTRLERVVALKVLAKWRTDDPGAVARFRREMKAVGQLIHPNIVQATDAGEQDGTHFLVMEFIEGADLGLVLHRHGKLPVAAACEVVRQAALGLQHAHEHDLVHRDVKPSNLLLTPQGQVKLLDLGLARLQGPRAAGEDTTDSNVIMGSFDYMAPEQADNAHQVDARTDLYSLGCTLYHLLAGEAPFPTTRYSTPFQKMTAHAGAAVPALSAVRPDVPAKLSGIVQRMMAKDRAHRFASAAEVAQVLQRFSGGADMASLLRPASVSPSRSRPALQCPADVTAATRDLRLARKRPWRWRAAAAGILGIAVLVAATVIYVRTDEGLLEIETTDENIKVSVERGGKEVVLLDLKTNKQVRLKSGDYSLRLVEGGKERELKPASFTLRRGDKEVVTVRRVGAPPLTARPEKGRPLDKEWLKFVSGLPPDRQADEVGKELQRRNPGFDGKVVSRTAGDTVTALLVNAEHVTDLTPLQALPRLESVGYWHGGMGKGKVADLAQLQGLSLTGLDCPRTDVADLTGLKGMKLTYLNCHQTRVADLGALKDMPLTRLDCSFTPVADLGPLKDTPLEQLSCMATKIKSLEPLHNVKTLVGLNCGETQVSDLSPLKGLRLIRLDCSKTRVTDLTPLRGMPLREISCAFVPERDSALLRTLPDLEKVNGKPVAEVLK